LNSIKVDLNKDAGHCLLLRCWICVDYMKLCTDTSPATVHAVLAAVHLCSISVW